MSLESHNNIDWKHSSSTGWQMIWDMDLSKRAFRAIDRIVESVNKLSLLVSLCPCSGWQSYCISSVYQQIFVPLTFMLVHYDQRYQISSSNFTRSAWDDTWKILKTVTIQRYVPGLLAFYVHQNIPAYLLHNKCFITE